MIAKTANSGSTLRDAIVDSVIAIMAHEGLSNLTYRKVASHAGASLALVNYHFPKRSGLIREASTNLLDGYKNSFERSAASLEAGERISMKEFTCRLLENALGRDRIRASAWMEIILDAVRNPQSLLLAQEWEQNLQVIWSRITTAIRGQQSSLSVRSRIDLIIGLMITSFALGLGWRDLESILGSRQGLSDLQKVGTLPSAQGPRGTTAKAAATSQKILSAAIELVVLEGAAGVTFANISRLTGLSIAAPAYHFGCIANLLAEAEITLIAETKSRYRDAMRKMDRPAMTASSLVDVTATILIREATEFKRENLAFFSNWLEAGRVMQLRPVVRSFVLDQIFAWRELLDSGSSKEVVPKDAPLLIVATFIGKLIRILSCGSRTEDLATVRKEFSTEIAVLLAHRYWD